MFKIDLESSIVSFSVLKSETVIGLDRAAILVITKS